MLSSAGTGDYRTDPTGYESALWEASGTPRPTPDPEVGRRDSRSDRLAAIEAWLQSLARAVRQFHTYPATSPLCTDAIAACHASFAALDGPDRLVLRVTPCQFLVEEAGVGGGTIVEHELVRRLHHAGVAELDIDRAATPRDLTWLCTDLIRSADLARTRTTLAEVFVEHGVETIVPRMARRPEVLAVGARPAELWDLADRERRRRAAAAGVGPTSYLYPPEKGWVRLDPGASADPISLVDLAVLVGDPAEIATMLLRLTDDDQAGAAAPAHALEQKYSDVVTLFSALDGHLARVMFGKLAEAVLAIPPDRRTALLRQTILPGLLDGRADSAVLRDFPDPDLAESLCLLLDLETAAPEVVTAALNRLDLPAERREAVASMVGARLATPRARSAAPSGADDPHLDRHARRLVQIEPAGGKSFAEFAAFDLSIDGHASTAIAGVCEAVAGADVIAAQLDCLWRLARLEPNPALVASFVRRALALFGELEREGRWRELAAAASRYRGLADELKELRPDVVEAIAGGLGEFWNRSRVAALVDLHDRDADGAAAATLLVDAFGVSLAPGFVDLLEGGLPPAKARSLASIMGRHAAALAPGLATRLDDCGLEATRAIVRVLGFAGAGYEDALSGRLTSRDEQTARDALKSLARIGTEKAAALVASQIGSDTPGARAAEEALRHFPPAEAGSQLRRLLGRRDFVLQHPDAVARLIDRASQAGTEGLDRVLEDLEAFRFRFWNPGLVRIALKARRLRGR